MGSPWSSGKRTRSATKGSAVQIPPILTSFGLGFLGALKNNWRFSNTIAGIVRKTRKKEV